MVSCEIEWIRERMSNLGESGILSLNEFVHSLGGTNCRFGYRGDEVTRNSTIRESTLANFLSLCDPGRAKTPKLGHPVDDNVLPPATIRDRRIVPACFVNLRIGQTCVMQASLG